MADVDLSGVVGDRVDRLFPQQGLEVRLGDVGFDEPGGRGDLLAATRRQVVHDDDPVPLADEPGSEVASDESRSARDEDVHRLAR